MTHTDPKQYPKLATLKVGDRITIYSFNALAMTSVERVTITRLPPPCFMHSELRFGVGLRPRKRKEHWLDCHITAGLIFQGWEQPFCADSEAKRPGGQSIWGNACVNLCGKAEDIINWVETRNLNDGFCDFGKIILYPPSGEEMLDNEGKLLYPDARVRHAVIDRMKRDAAETVAAV